jgi:hypothetical protein
MQADVLIVLLASELLAPNLSIAALFDGKRITSCNDQAAEEEPILTRSELLGNQGFI